MTGTVKANSGIALIVAADELKTLLDSPALQAFRDAQGFSAKAKESSEVTAITARPYAHALFCSQVSQHSVRRVPRAGGLGPPGACAAHP